MSPQLRWGCHNNKETEEKQYVTRHCRSGDIIIITRFVIASNNGWHPRPPIARRAAAILKISKSKSASTHASHHFCKISLSLKHFENFDIFAVSMVTAAILKIPTSNVNFAYASDHSCKVSSSLQHFYFFWNFWHFGWFLWLHRPFQISNGRYQIGTWEGPYHQSFKQFDLPF